MSDMSVSADTLEKLHLSARNYEWVDTDLRLAELCRQWRQQPLVALDTEFQRTDTFYPRPGLIQVASDGRCYLLDPLKIEDFGPFVELMTDPAVLKLLHACSEDLELFAHCYDAVPQPMFDCQVACAFLGMGLSIGYQRLLEQQLGVEVDKEETRSDWLQRPLTESQKLYAAKDVIYLKTIYQQLEAELRTQDKYSWVLEECRQLTDAAMAPEDIENSYQQRFKQAWKLRPRQLSVLKALSTWREEQARERDMPRNFLLHNNSMMAIAMRPPGNMRELSMVERVRGRTLSEDGKQLLKLVKDSWEVDPEAYPEQPPRPLSASWSKQLKPLKELVRVTAEELNLAPEILVRRKDLEQLVRSGMESGEFSLPEELRGWRRGVIGQPLLERLQTGDKES